MSNSSKPDTSPSIIQARSRRLLKLKQQLRRANRYRYLGLKRSRRQRPTQSTMQSQSRPRKRARRQRVLHPTAELARQVIELQTTVSGFQQIEQEEDIHMMSIEALQTRLGDLQKWQHVQTQAQVKGVATFSQLPTAVVGLVFRFVVGPTVPNKSIAAYFFNTGILQLVSRQAQTAVHRYLPRATEGLKCRDAVRRAMAGEPWVLEQNEWRAVGKTALREVYGEERGFAHWSFGKRMTAIGKLIPGRMQRSNWAMLAKLLVLSTKNLEAIVKAEYKPPIYYAEH